jgi:hypothetical protein
MYDFRLMPALFVKFCCLLMALLMISLPACAAKKKSTPPATPTITAPELQSQIMSFADRFMARVGGSTADYVYVKGYATTPLIRMAVHTRRLSACQAAVSIAGGSNPEVAMLDMVVLVTLLRLTTEEVWIPKKLVPNGQILLDAYVELERDIWLIATEVLSKEQADELRNLIDEWHTKNINALVGVTSIRFGDFAKKRRQSTLFKDGKASGFLKAVSEANQEIEQARILAERTIFMAERQPTLIRWQVEQIFFDLAMEPEIGDLLNSSADIGRAAARISMTVEKMPKLITSERKAAIEQAFRGLNKEIAQIISGVSKERQAAIEQALQGVGKERSDAVAQTISELSKERQALIDQTSETILEKAFYLGALLILLLLLGAIVSRLIYRYLEIRLFEKK